jgi:ankyrin repeat protein
VRRSAPLLIDQQSIIKAVCSGSIAQLKTALLMRELDLDATNPDTGMTALHMAVGFNRLDMVKLIVAAGAKFSADYEGRLPSIMAADLQVDEELQDYITSAETGTLEQSGANGATRAVYTASVGRKTKPAGKG